MTVETMFGIIMSTMLAIIGFWVKTLVNDFKQTRDNVIAMHEVMSNTTNEIIALKKSDELITQRIVEIIERLVRLEERTGHTDPKPRKAYKRVTK
jgi:Flp pilus assembly protein TadB